MVPTPNHRTLFLVDGTSQLYRAYFALPGLTNAEGLPTNAVFGFTSMLRKLIRDEGARYLAVAFDLPGPVFRHETYPQYKANRPPTPEDLRIQAPYAKQVSQVLGARVLEQAGFEADDLIATYARLGREQGFDVVVVASDKDLLQLVRPGVRVFNPSKNVFLGPDEVVESLGVPAERVLDVQGLMGDSVDNIPGVPGVGAKTAVGIVATYGDLDTVLARAARFVAALDAREAFLAAMNELQRSAEAQAGSAQRVAATGEALARELERLAADEPASELADRLSRAAIRLAAIDWVVVGAAQGAGKRVVSDLRELKKDLEALDRGSAQRAWYNIHEFGGQARLSRELARLHDRVPVDEPPEALRREPIDRGRALALFSALGFTALVREFTATTDRADEPELAETALPVSTPRELVALSVVDGDEALHRLVTDCRSAGSIALATLLDGADPLRATCTGVALAHAAGHGAFVSLVGPGRPPGVPDALAPLLADAGIAKWGHDVKRQAHALRRAGLPVSGWKLDTMVAAFLLHPGRPDYRSDGLAQEFLGDDPAMPAAGPPGARQMTLALEPEEQPPRRAIERAEATLRLAPLLAQRLADAGLSTLYEEIDGPLLPLLARMEQLGIRIDSAILERMSAEMGTRLEQLRAEIHELAGKSFNVDSPKQLREVLFDDLGLAPGRKTAKSKVASTDAQTLEELAERHSIAQRLLEYRELAKLKGTYVDALPRLIHPETGRVHTSFDPTGAATGRLSSSDPNLQNIPARSEAGRQIRSAFVPEAGWLFLASDYSQVELRVLAHMCGDEALIGAFAAGEDIHRYTAARIFGVETAEVTSTMRRRAKAVNFGILYGMSEVRLAREQGIPREEARSFIRTYFDRFSRVRGYIDGVREQALRDAAVRTLFGRVRFFPQLHQRVNRGVQEQAYRAAVNTTIQGTAADLMKMAMLAVDQALSRAGSPARILLQVHDELLLEVRRDDVEEVGMLVRRAMEGVQRLAVPLAVDQKVGASWLDVT